MKAHDQPQAMQRRGEPQLARLLGQAVGSHGEIIGRFVVGGRARVFLLKIIKIFFTSERKIMESQRLFGREGELEKLRKRANERESIRFSVGENKERERK